MSTTPRVDASAAAPRRGRGRWSRWVWLGVIGLSLGYALWGDLAHVRWASALSREGSPPPAVQLDSPTGFAGGQRHFLGTNQRGETYRWIAATQAFLRGDAPDPGDTVPTGRPSLLPKLYIGWLAALSRATQLANDLPAPIAVERVAAWEAGLVHQLALIGAIVFMARRFGLAWGGGTGLLLALHPLVFSQHVPGSLSADPWALWAAAYALASELARPRDAGPGGFGLAPTVAAAVSLMLNPAFGFPAVLILAATGASGAESTDRPYLRWSALGALLVMVGWLMTRVPWDVSASELRTVHPWYALAWLGLGLAVDAWQRQRQPVPGRRSRSVAQAAAGVALLAPLVYAQVAHGYRGWLHPTADLQRLAPLDGSPIHSHLFAWWAAATAAERLLVLGPVLAGAIALAGRGWRRGAEPATRANLPYSSLIAFGAVLLLAGFHVRWLLVATLLSVPAIATAAASVSTAMLRTIGTLAAMFLFALFAWGQSPPSHLRGHRPPAGPSTGDLEALVFRHFSHWFAKQTAGREVRVLAPPALADSLVYHGGCRVLLSSAWESHPGHLAAARILSAPESTEAEAVIQSLGLTHLVLTSWDPVLPLLVKPPLERERDTLHERLQRWVLPLYLRPLPYRLPATPGFAAEKVAVFEVVAPQDEALALSRLAEYFIEVERPEPARLVVESLDRAYPQDLNATIARALVHEKTGNVTAFRTEVDRLAGSVERDLHPTDEDRRVLRAIVLALGRRHDLARSELAASCPRLSVSTLELLTPLQLFRLRRLVELYRLEFPQPELAEFARTRSADYTL